MPLTPDDIARGLHWADTIDTDPVAKDLLASLVVLNARELLELAARGMQGVEKICDENAIMRQSLILARLTDEKLELLKAKLRTFANEHVCPVNDNCQPGFVAGAFTAWGWARNHVSKLLDDISPSDPAREAEAGAESERRIQKLLGELNDYHEQAQRACVNLNNLDAANERLVSDNVKHVDEIARLNKQLSLASEKVGELEADLAALRSERDELLAERARWLRRHESALERACELKPSEVREELANEHTCVVFLEDRLTKTERDRDELAKWKSLHQQALASMAMTLLDAGYKGDGVVGGIKCLVAEIDRLQRQEGQR